MLVPSLRIEALFFHLGFILLVAFPTTGLATDCSKVPAVCTAKCERFNMSTKAVECWCSGSPSGCRIDSTLCAHANSINDIAYDELIACMQSCRSTSPSSSAGTSSGVDKQGSCDAMGGEYIQELLDFLQR